jgi:hypothetical protein
MQAFEVNWLRWLVVMSASGIVLAIAVYLGFYLPSLPGRPASEKPAEEYAAGIRVMNRGIPPILILVYVGMFIFIVAYMIYVWVAKISF